MRSKIRGKLTKGKYNNLTERSLGVRALTVVGQAAGHSAARRVGNLKSGIEDGGQRDLDEQLVNATANRLRNTPSWMRHGFKRWRHKRKWKKAWEKEWPRAKGYFRKIPKPPPPPRIRTKATRKRFKADMKQAWRSSGQEDLEQNMVNLTRFAGREAFRPAGRLTAKLARRGTKRLGRGAKRLGRAARHAAQRGAQAVAQRAALTAIQASLRIASTTQTTVATIGAAVGAVGAMLPGIMAVLAAVMALCAILPSFITGVGAEHERRQQAAQPTCVGGSTPGHAVTAAEVAEWLPNPNGKDISLLLTAEQRATATAIVEEGQKAGIPPRGWAIALMTAMQESTMGANPSTKRPNADVDVGVFQQRAKVGWYADGATVEENTNILNDVHYAARTFYLGHDVAVRHGDGAGSIGYHIPGLVNVEGWQSMDLGQAAQTVQVSDFPDYYAKHEATVASLLPTLQTQGCTAVAAGSSPAVGVDDYGPYWASRGNVEGEDEWAFYWGECVSYAAFAVRTYSPHKDFVNNWRGAHFGNAKEWDEAARELGIRVDQTPTVGAIAQHSRNKNGHVAYITAVHEDGTFDVNEYNHGPRHKFGTRSHVSIPKDFDVVIHFEEPLAS
mgnify:CR=1 FL=1